MGALLRPSPERQKRLFAARRDGRRPLPVEVELPAGGAPGGEAFGELPPNFDDRGKARINKAMVPMDKVRLWDEGV